MLNEDILEIFKNSYTKSECAKKLGHSHINGTSIRKVDEIIKLHNIDVSHFDRYRTNRKKRIYEKINKNCPVCGVIFETLKGHSREKTTCSHSCSNTYFNGISRNVIVTNYRTICFRHHEKQCIVCGESKIVEVHHYNENNKDNSPENLIPLCPTHHQYWHSRYKNEVFDKVDYYRKQFKGKHE